MQGIWRWRRFDWVYIAILPAFNAFWFYACHAIHEYMNIIRILNITKLVPAPLSSFLLRSSTPRTTITHFYSVFDDGSLRKTHCVKGFGNWMCLYLTMFVLFWGVLWREEKTKRKKTIYTTKKVERNEGRQMMIPQD